MTIAKQMAKLATDIDKHIDQQDALTEAVEAAWTDIEAHVKARDMDALFEVVKGAHKNASTLTTSKDKEMQMREQFDALRRQLDDAADELTSKAGTKS